jgi:large subunit ribosomal protein L6|uniref:Large ribosomal subunit protein uL6c n=1 Tax=Didymosphenia geminata TaxID=1115533 RepID=A0A023HAR7_9STRA|nr:ribosomal protein L6 [Didymosphenia geminata]AGH28781.1 ribosomal protein L6 [Didymosphenia geminata]
MSRIGKLPITIPENVEVKYQDSTITIKGQFGTLITELPDLVIIVQENNNLKVKLKEETKKVRALHGLYRTLINNMVIGVSKQFNLTLVLKGVGYRAVVQGSEIVLSLGYSHPVKIEIPKQISVEVIQNTTVNLKSCDKELLGLFASNIRAWRQPEPYKGKGILYKGEQILRKAGKSSKK